MSNDVAYIESNQAVYTLSGDGYYLHTYGTYTPSASVSRLELKNMRYPNPDRDYSPRYMYNLRSVEINYIVRASGAYLLEPEKNGERATAVREGQIIVIQPGHPYAWKGMLEACVVHSEKYYPEQQIYVSKEEALKMMG
jgi:hypothetical protein